MPQQPQPKQAADRLTQDNPGRTFKVVSTLVGPFPKDHVFSEFEFQRLHPLPDNPQTRSAGFHGDGIDEATYRNNLIRRLLDEGAIVPADPSAEAQPTPLGPENALEKPPPGPGAATPVPQVIPAVGTHAAK